LPHKETISEFYSGRLSDMSDIDTSVVDSNLPITNFCESSRSVGIVYGELLSINTSVGEVGELCDSLSTYGLPVLLVFPAPPLATFADVPSTGSAAVSGM
jgi:hypothetical protein